MLRSLDSCIPVAIAMVRARAGSARCIAWPARRATVSAWSGWRYQSVPSSEAAHLITCGTASARLSRAAIPAAAPPTTPMKPTVATSARMRRRRAARRRGDSAGEPIRGEIDTSVRMQVRVEGHADARPGQRLDRTGDRVATEEQPVAAGQVARGDHPRPVPAQQGHLGARREVEAGLHDAVVTEADAQPGVGADQGTAPDGDRDPATTGQGAHDRGTAADVAAVVDDHPGRDPALDHRDAERPGVEVDEALVHHRGALGEMGAQTHPVGVGDPDAGRDHVVHHPRELVDAEDRRSVAVDRAQPQPGLLEPFGRARPAIGPHDIGQYPEDTVQVETVRAHQPVREQMQPEVGIGGARRRAGQLDLGRHHLGPHAAGLVGVGQRPQAVQQLGVVGRVRAEGRAGVPDVQHGPIGRDGGQAVSPRGGRVRRRRIGHGRKPRGGAAVGRTPSRLAAMTDPPPPDATAAWGHGLATVTADGTVLDVWYPRPALGPHAADDAELLDRLRALANTDEARGVRTEVVTTEIQLAGAPSGTADAYLRLHLLSHRLVRPHGLNLDGVFGVLPNVVWTDRGPCSPEGFEETRLRLRTVDGHAPTVFGIDKFPRMVDYVVPSGVRIADADRVRLGAHLAEGTTVMHEGFVNFNAGTLGVSMIEGRISAGVVVDDGSDIGGGASIMGTLSGGGRVTIAIGRRSLVGANAGLGISLGDDCVVEAGLYLTAGTQVTLAGRDGRGGAGVTVLGGGGPRGAAVRWRPASTTQSSPRLMPSPALAPTRERRPIAIVTRPPPDRVPMIEAPPPMSLPSSTTTPAEIRPSIIETPSVPALKLTKPSCITVVPSARWAPRRTRSASAIRTPDGTT